MNLVRPLRVGFERGGESIHPVFIFGQGQEGEAYGLIYGGTTTGGDHGLRGGNSFGREIHLHPPIIRQRQTDRGPRLP